MCQLQEAFKRLHSTIQLAQFVLAVCIRHARPALHLLVTSLAADLQVRPVQQTNQLGNIMVTLHALSGLHAGLVVKPGRQPS
jgi:hypothetical protein